MKSWHFHHILQSEGGWESGPEEGGIARAFAARALAELCAAPELHGTISRSGAAKALAEHGAEAVSAACIALLRKCYAIIVLPAWSQLGWCSCRDQVYPSPPACPLHFPALLLMHIHTVKCAATGGGQQERG